MRRAAPVAAVLAAAGGVLLGACRPGAVRVDFQPSTGSRYSYAIDVRADTTTAIQGRAPSHTVTEERLDAHHTIESVDTAGVVVDVEVTGANSPTRSFEVRLDRAGSLVEVQRVEDIPASALGDLGLSEVFPAAAGAPPNHPLRPGATWRIREPVTLPGSRTTQLTGSGRLVQIGVVDGRQVATIDSTYKLGVHQTSTTEDGTVTLDGDQTTVTSATHALHDGAVQTVKARTQGRFSLTVGPPAGVGGPTLQGSLDVEVRSTTTRKG